VTTAEEPKTMVIARSAEDKKGELVSTETSLERMASLLKDVSGRELTPQQ
jgi:hypothetical protein